MAVYRPESYFYTDLNALGAPTADGAFGPVTGNLTTQYRTTSMVSGTGKVYAICNGHILIQPQTGSSDKVNLILKPLKPFAGLKIKYFIYRGVNKDDLIQGTNMHPTDDDDPNQPDVLKRIWKEFVDFNLPFYQQGVINTPPDTIPATNIGYGVQPPDMLIDYAFTLADYQIPSCKMGEFIGNFSGSLGLDIVLDYGDHELTHQEDLFRLDLFYAREKEFVFNTTPIQGENAAVRVKRYREHILQFMDAAAFWGSHINTGTIKTSTGDLHTASQIAGGILSTYTTGDKIYIYVQGEYERSYNYYDEIRKIYGFTTGGELAKTNDWPILIKSIPIAGEHVEQSLQLDNAIDPSVPQKLRKIVIDLFAPKSLLQASFPIVQDPQPTAVTTQEIPITLYGNNTQSTATFAFIYGKLKQPFPLENYYNDLWTVNINTVRPVDDNQTAMIRWANYDRNTLVNLDDTLGVGAAMHQKVIFDHGYNPDTQTSKKRRLYMAVIKNNSSKDTEYKSYNITEVTAGISPVRNNTDYALQLYNDPDFRVYKGTFSDGTNVNALSLVHHKNFLKKNSFYHLGITEEEYNKLVFNNPAPTDTTPQYLPADAQKVQFYLNEDTTFNQVNVRKFELGLSFEDSTGVRITAPMYPTTNNKVYIYTTDGLYFFSKDYSDYQEYDLEYPQAVVQFRPLYDEIIPTPPLDVIPPYNGEFGFDWMRLGDTQAKGDINYKTIVAKQYTDTNFNQLVLNTNRFDGEFLPDEEMFKRLELEYDSFPVQYDGTGDIFKYYVPTLTIYPPYQSIPGFGIDLDRQQVFTPPYDDEVNRVANLLMLIEVNENFREIVFQYNTSLIKLSDPLTPIQRLPQIPSNQGGYDIPLKIQCLDELGQTELINVVAHGYSGESKVIGVLKIAPNQKQFRKSKKVLFVDVITDTRATGVRPPEYSLNEQAKFMKKFLRQILATPQIETEVIDLQTIPDNVFYQNYVINYGNPNAQILLFNHVTPITPFYYLTEYLSSKLPQSQYQDYFVLFLMRDIGGAIMSDGTYQGTAGWARDNYMVDFRNEYPSTATHELMHTLNVQHTFANFEANHNAIYTYWALQTNNILDYSDVEGPVQQRFPTISLYEWQGKIARKELIDEP